MKTNTRIYKMPVARVYPLYITKVERKGRTKAEVDEIIRWLTGHTQKGLEAQLKKQTDFETFFAKAPKLNPARTLIKGMICGVRIEEIKEPTMREIRYLDKLIDELAKGKTMEKILNREDAAKVPAVNPEIKKYNASQSKKEKTICNTLSSVIFENLPKAENKIWHRHPVWFLDGNPVVGYAVLKESVQLLFWSGQSFDEKGLQKEGAFKAAQIRYTDANQIVAKDLKRWIKKAKEIQWDYKNIVKRKGKLVRI